MYQVGEDWLIEPLFKTTGTLNNTVDNEAIANPLLIFAFAHDLGTVGTSGSTPIVYTIGHERDPLVQFSNVPSVNSTRHPYYLTRYGTVLDMVYPLCAPCVAMLTWPFPGRCNPR